ncbi:MAG: glutamine amidotransferase, partial [Anaerolineae bacterium]|nr:glutamine amidotransferase [Anaerolineae bacterium]
SNAGATVVDIGRSGSAYQFTTQVKVPGFFPVRACIEPSVDNYIENNCAETWLVVQGVPKVLVVGIPEEREIISRVLDAGGLAADEVGPESMPVTLEGLAAYQAVVLINSPARALPKRAMEVLVPYVRDLGGGVIAIGGPASYGVGGWLGTPLEQVLPVEMLVQDPRRFPPMVLAIVIDTSGSMSSDEQGVAKITLAGEAAVRAAESLNAGDTILVVGFSTEPDISIGPLDIAEGADVTAEITSLRAGGGGIFVYESLDYVLARISTLPSVASRLHHILLLVDGSDAEHQSGAFDLAEQAQEMGATVSVVAIGSGEDVPFLSSLADAGQGRFYLAASAAHLPVIFTEEVARVKRSYIVEQIFYPEIHTTWSPVAQLEEFPPLLGYVAASPKASADVVWAAGDLDPLLVTWQYGLGRTVAWTSDAQPRWSAHWLSWDAYVVFWNAVVRSVLLPEADVDLSMGIDYHPEMTRVVVDVTTADGGVAAGVTPDGLQLNVQFSGQNLDRADVQASLEQVAPGRYEADVGDLDRHPYLVRLYGDRNLVMGWTPPPALEYVPGIVENALDVLAGQSGAPLVGSVDDMVRRGPPVIQQGQLMTQPLLLTSAMVWLCSIAWRRFGLAWSSILAPVKRKVGKVFTNTASSMHHPTGKGTTQALEEQSAEHVKVEDSQPANLAAQLRQRLRDREQDSGE